MFSNRLNLWLPEWTCIEKTVHKVETHWLTRKYKKIKVQWSVKKVMLIALWDMKGAITIDFLKKTVQLFKQDSLNLLNDSHIRGSLNKFPDFFVWVLLLIVHTWNSCPLRSNFLRLQCTCCTVPTTSGRPHGSPLVRACQWPSSRPLSSPQLSQNNSLWA